MAMIMGARYGAVELSNRDVGIIHAQRPETILVRLRARQGRDPRVVSPCRNGALRPYLRPPASASVKLVDLDRQPKNSIAVKRTSSPH